MRGNHHLVGDSITSIIVWNVPNSSVIIPNLYSQRGLLKTGFVVYIINLDIPNASNNVSGVEH